MPHSLLQAPKSTAASRALVQALGPSPFSHATVEALCPHPPPPACIDRIEALAPDLFLPPHADLLIMALFVVLLWCGGGARRENRAKRYLSKAPQDEYHGSMSAPEPCAAQESHAQSYIMCDIKPNQRNPELLDSLRRRRKGSVLQMIQGLEAYSAALKMDSEQNGVQHGIECKEDKFSSHSGHACGNCYTSYDEDITQQIEAMVAEGEARFANRKSKRKWSFRKSRVDLSIRHLSRRLAV